MVTGISNADLAKLIERKKQGAWYKLYVPYILFVVGIIMAIWFLFLH